MASKAEKRNETISEQSKWVERMVQEIDEAGLPAPTKEHRFSNRKFRFDLAWIDLRIALEVEGGLWIRGRHVRPAGYERDCEKYNLATLLGWRVFRVTPRHIRQKKAIEMLQAVFRQPATPMLIFPIKSHTQNGADNGQQQNRNTRSNSNKRGTSTRTVRSGNTRETRTNLTDGERTTNDREPADFAPGMGRRSRVRTRAQPAVDLHRRRERWNDTTRCLQGDRFERRSL